jgi:hypothetical protein
VVRALVVYSVPAGKVWPDFSTVREGMGRDHVDLGGALSVTPAASRAPVLRLRQA